MKLEQQVVSSLLFKPSEIKNVDIDLSWFVDKSNKEIVESIVNTDGNERDILLLAEHIKDNNSQTKVDDEYIYNLSSMVVTSANLERYVQELEYRYIKNRLVVASERFTNNPTEKNKDAMQERMMELEALSVEEDTGSLKSTVEEIYHSLEYKSEPGILTYPSIDNVLGGGMFGGTLITIGARPGVGKTAFGINLAVEAMIKQPGLHTDFFTLEMSKKQMLNRFISKLSRINSYDLRDPFERLDAKQKASVIDSTTILLNNHFRIHDKCFELNQIARRIRKSHYEADGKPYIAFIDYLGLIGVKDQKQPRHVQVGEITRVMKMLTNELDIPIVLFTQLNRGIEARQDKEPLLSDIRESGAVEQDSNVVMFLSEPVEQQHNTDVVVAKNREGSLRKLRFNFLKSKMDFLEVD